MNYVQEWYLDIYGLNPPPGMDWDQLSFLVSKVRPPIVAG